MDFEDPDMVERSEAQLIGMSPISDQCSVNGCDVRASSVAYYERDGDDPIVWSCDDHINHFADIGLVSEYEFTRIDRTCGLAQTDTPCGAVATHLVVLRDGDDNIRTASVRARHADPERRKQAR